MNFLSLFKFPADEPKFNHGDRVNHYARGAQLKTDGFVVAQTNQGVLIEWPQGGSSVVSSFELTRISDHA